MTSINSVTSGGAPVRGWRVVSEAEVARTERTRLEQRRDTQREAEGVVSAAEAALRDASARQARADQQTLHELPTISVATVANAEFVKQVLQNRLEAYRAQTRIAESQADDGSDEPPPPTNVDKPSQSDDAPAESPGKLDTYA